MKNEEVFLPKLAQLLHATENSFSVDQLIKKEVEMIKTLNYLLHPTTMNFWMNHQMVSWDEFIDRLVQQRRVQMKNGKLPPKFREKSLRSYSLYRKTSQYLDCCLLHKEIYKLDQKRIVSSILYAVLHGEMNESHSYFDPARNSKTDFESIFEEFQVLTFGFTMKNMEQPMEFVRGFMSLNITMEYPLAARIDEKVLEGHYEDFLSFFVPNPRIIADFYSK